jgi:hypothetical protein
MSVFPPRHEKREKGNHKFYDQLTLVCRLVRMLRLGTKRREDVLESQQRHQQQRRSAEREKESSKKSIRNQKTQKAPTRKQIIVCGFRSANQHEYSSQLLVSIPRTRRRPNPITINPTPSSPPPDGENFYSRMR